MLVATAAVIGLAIAAATRLSVRIRLTIAVQLEGGKPFVSTDEMDVSRASAGAEWVYEAPIRWPGQARRVGVTVEELKTGAKGSGSTDLPAGR